MKAKLFSIAMVAGLCMIIVFSNPSFSQETIEVKVESAQMSKGMQTGYMVEIPMAILKDVQQNWIKRLQENIKTRVIASKDEWVLAKVVKSEISSDTISIYSLFIEKEDHIVMNVFVEFDSVFFSPKEDKTQLTAEKTDNSIKNYIRKFAVEQYSIAAEADLNAEQRILEELENDLEKLVKDNENLNKDISSLENDIEKTERKITSLDQQIELKDQEILAHKTSMQGLVGEDEKKAALEKDKALEKEKNKLEKERVNAKDDISNMKSKIDKNNKTIKDNEKLQEEKQEEINVQKEDVAKAQNLFNGIK
jgi:DNA repair exonuclease SbcCD ATPase subunit